MHQAMANMCARRDSALRPAITANTAALKHSSSARRMWLMKMDSSR